MYEDYFDGVYNRRPIEPPFRKVGDIFLYIVAPGDNVYAIARKYRSKVEWIVCMNMLPPNAKIYPRQELLVPTLNNHMSIQPPKREENTSLYF